MDENREDFRWRTVKCQIQERYEHRDKAEDVENQDRSIHPQRCFAEDSIEINRKQICCVGQEFALPLLMVVRRVILRV